MYSQEAEPTNDPIVEEPLEEPVKKTVEEPVAETRSTEVAEVVEAIEKAKPRTNHILGISTSDKTIASGMHGMWEKMSLHDLRYSHPKYCAERSQE